MKRAFLCLFIVAAPAYLLAQNAPVVAADSTPAQSAPTPVLSSQKWLDTRGMVSSDELVDVLGAKLSPDQRKHLDEAVARRNAALQKANDDLAGSLRDLLKETDAGLSKRVDESAEERRMERMKRLQPMRYQQLMGRKKNKEEEKTPTAQP